MLLVLKSKYSFKKRPDRSLFMTMGTGVMLCFVTLFVEGMSRNPLQLSCGNEWFSVDGQLSICFPVKFEVCYIQNRFVINWCQNETMECTFQPSVYRCREVLRKSYVSFIQKWCIRTPPEKRTDASGWRRIFVVMNMKAAPKRLVKLILYTMLSIEMFKDWECRVMCPGREKCIEMRRRATRAKRCWTGTDRQGKVSKNNEKWSDCDIPNACCAAFSRYSR